MGLAVPWSGMESNGGQEFESILVVEDDAAIRETLKLAIELDGYQVFTAADGRIGIDLLHKIPRPSFILLDLMMPEMNGWEFVEAIEKEGIFSDIPIVVLTAFADKAKTIRAAEVIKKPVDIEALSRVVKKYSKRYSKSA